MAIGKVNGVTAPFLPLAGGTMTGTLNMGGQALTDNFEAFAAFLYENKLRHLAMDSGSMANTKVGSGDLLWSSPEERVLASGATANSSIISHLSINCMNPATLTYGYNDWDLPLILSSMFTLDAADTQAVTRIQLKEANTLGELGEKGIGLIATNLTLTAEAYGTSRDTSALGTLLATAARAYKVDLILRSTGLTIRINGASVGTITTAGKFPTGDGAAQLYFCVSHQNGAAGTSTNRRFFEPHLLQGAA